MKNFVFPDAALHLGLLALCCGGVRSAEASPQHPVITVTDETGMRYLGKRVVARYGIAPNPELQSKLAVKQLSFLLKKHPDARSWAVAYNTAPQLWRVLEYDIELRRLIEVKNEKNGKSKGWQYGFFPAHIHRAAQQSLNIEGLWKLKNTRKNTVRQ